MVIVNIIIILGVILHPIHSVNVNVDEDIFTINVTMKGYQSTNVMLQFCDQSKEHLLIPFKIGRSNCICSVSITGRRVDN